MNLFISQIWWPLGGFAHSALSASSFDPSTMTLLWRMSLCFWIPTPWASTKGLDTPFRPLSHFSPVGEWACDPSLAHHIVFLWHLYLEQREPRIGETADCFSSSSASRSLALVPVAETPELPLFLPFSHSFIFISLWATPDPFHKFLSPYFVCVSLFSRNWRP